MKDGMSKFMGTCKFCFMVIERAVDVYLFHAQWFVVISIDGSQIFIKDGNL